MGKKKAASQPPPPPLWQVIVSKIITTMWVFLTAAWMTYFVFFYEGAFDRPLEFLQETVICAFGASMFAALLTQLWFSQGNIRGTFKGISFAFTGAAAVFFAIIFLYFQVRPTEDYPAAVVYTVQSSTNASFRMDLRVEQVGNQPGEAVTIFKERLRNGETWKVIVVYPPDIYSATIRLTSEEGSHNFKLHHTDGQTRKTLLLLPSGEQGKE